MSDQQTRAKAKRRKRARHQHRSQVNNVRYLYKFVGMTEVEKCQATLKDDKNIVHIRWWKTLGANARMRNTILAVTAEGLMPFDEVVIH